MTISFYKGLNRYPEIGIPSSDFCLIPGDWSELGIPIWHEHLEKNATESCKMPGLQLLPFLSY